MSLTVNTVSYYFYKNSDTIWTLYLSETHLFFSTLTPRSLKKMANCRKAINLSKFFYWLTFFLSFQSTLWGGVRKINTLRIASATRKICSGRLLPTCNWKEFTSSKYVVTSAESKRKKSLNRFLFHFQTLRLREHKCFTSEMSNEWLQYTHTFLFLEKLHIKEHFLAWLTCRDMELSRVMNSLTLICTHDTQLKSPFTFLPGCQSQGKPFWQQSAKRTN